MGKRELELLRDLRDQLVALDRHKQRKSDLADLALEGQVAAWSLAPIGVAVVEGLFGEGVSASDDLLALFE